jgi:hypothetical protein
MYLNKSLLVEKISLTSSREVHVQHISKYKKIFSSIKQFFLTRCMVPDHEYAVGVREKLEYIMSKTQPQPLQDRY